MTDFDAHADEVFKYTKDIMGLDPADCCVVLAKVAVRILCEQSPDKATRDVATRFYLQSIWDDVKAGRF